MDEGCLDHEFTRDDCDACYLLERAATLKPDNPLDSVDIAAEEIRREADYAGRKVEPSFLLRRVASRYPEFEWLAFLPPEERHWYLTVGGDPGYVRESFFPHLEPWAFEALAS